jgi:hypothetical protein
MLYSSINDELFSSVKKLIQAFLTRDKLLTRLFILLFIISVIGGTIQLLSLFNVLDSEIWDKVFFIFVGIDMVILILIYAYQSNRQQDEINAKILEVEKEVKKHPENPSAAWDLARIKLESYLNRNISQVRWIFFWTVIVMIAGFIIIGYGIYKIYTSPANFQPSILVSIVGILTELIGATFLIIYKSTMNQAKEYVNILERINAVGMSVQILESIDKTAVVLQNNTRAEIAKELLKIYGNKS